MTAAPTMCRFYRLLCSREVYETIDRDQIAITGTQQNSEIPPELMAPIDEQPAKTNTSMTIQTEWVAKEIRTMIQSALGDPKGVLCHRCNHISPTRERNRIHVRKHWLQCCCPCGYSSLDRDTLTKRQKKTRGDLASACRPFIVYIVDEKSFPRWKEETGSKLTSFPIRDPALQISLSLLVPAAGAVSTSTEMKPIARKPKEAERERKPERVQNRNHMTNAHVRATQRDRQDQNSHSKQRKRSSAPNESNSDSNQLTNLHEQEDDLIRNMQRRAEKFCHTLGMIKKFTKKGEDQYQTLRLKIDGLRRRQINE